MGSGSTSEGNKKQKRAKSNGDIVKEGKKQKPAALENAEQAGGGMHFDRFEAVRNKRQEKQRERLQSVFSTSLGNTCIDQRIPAEKSPDAELESGIPLRGGADAWPPMAPSMEHFIKNPPQEYTPPYYIAEPPPVIWIDTGRQLFVDDFLVESTNLTRRWHRATVTKSQVLETDKPWEGHHDGHRTARPFGGGSLLDPATQEVLLWYRCGWRGIMGRTCVARSKDGFTFTKPGLPDGVRPPGSPASSNVVIESQHVEAFEVAYDHMARPPRFIALRMEYMTGGKHYGHYVPYESSNGFHWQKRKHADSPGVMADRSTFFLNPLRKKPVWVLSLRENLCQGGHGHMRARRYWEHPYNTFMPAHARGQNMPAHPVGVNMTLDLGSRYTSQKYEHFLSKYFQCVGSRRGAPVPWAAVDRHDCGARACDLYNVDGIAYESIMLHGMAILHKPHGGELKNNTIHVAFSRDGFHMSRYEDHLAAAPVANRKEKYRRPFIEVGHNVSNLQLASGSPILSQEGTEEERLLFYYGFGAKDGYPDLRMSKESVTRNYFEGTGLAILRRDGFASFATLPPRAAANDGHDHDHHRHHYQRFTLTTRTLAFEQSKNYLFVNVILPDGSSLVVEVLQGGGASGATEAKPICSAAGTPFELGLVGPLDSTRARLLPLSPGGGEDLFGRFAGQQLRLRFTFTTGMSPEAAQLFSFWVSHAKTGEGGGFLAGGAFGRRSIRDIRRP